MTFSPYPRTTLQTFTRTFQTFGGTVRFDVKSRVYVATRRASASRFAVDPRQVMSGRMVLTILYDTCIDPVDFYSRAKRIAAQRSPGIETASASIVAPPVSVALGFMVQTDSDSEGSS